MASWSIRRVEAASERDMQGLVDVLSDCVEGGASVSFMLPMTRDKAEACATTVFYKYVERVELSLQPNIGQL